MTERGKNRQWKKKIKSKSDRQMRKESNNWWGEVWSREKCEGREIWSMIRNDILSLLLYFYFDQMLLFLSLKYNWTNSRSPDFKGQSRNLKQNHLKVKEKFFHKYKRNIYFFYFKHFYISQKYFSFHRSNIIQWKLLVKIQLIILSGYGFTDTFVTDSSL